MNANAVSVEIRSPKQPSVAVDVQARRTRLLVDTIVIGNPKGVRSLAYQLGYMLTPRTSLHKMALRMLTDFGSHAFDELVKIHPDRELILQVCGPGSQPSIAEPIAEAGFDGATPPSTLSSLAAGVILHHRDRLLELMGQYGVGLPIDAPDQDVVNGLVLLLNNPHQRGDAFRAAFTRLATSPYAPFAGIGEAIGGIGSMLGGVTNVIAAGTQRRAGQDKQRSDMMLSLLNQRTVAQQAQAGLGQSAISEAAATRRRLYTLLAVGGVVLVLGLAAVLVFGGRRAAA